MDFFLPHILKWILAAEFPPQNFLMVKEWKESVVVSFSDSR